MPRYFILIKRKNSKRYLGALPGRKGISLVALRKAAREQIKPGFQYRIITETQLRKILPRLLKKPKGMKRMRRKKSMKRSSKKRTSRKRVSRKRSMMKKRRKR